MFERGLQELETSSFRWIRRELKREGWRIFVLPRGITDNRAFIRGARKALPLDPRPPTDDEWRGADRALGAGLAALRDPHVAILWPRADRLAVRHPQGFKVARGILAAGATQAEAAAESAVEAVAVVVFSRRLKRPEPPLVWQGR
jgi:hypothetical protein